MPVLRKLVSPMLTGLSLVKEQGRSVLAHMGETLFPLGHQKLIETGVSVSPLWLLSSSHTAQPSQHGQKLT